MVDKLYKDIKIFYHNGEYDRCEKKLLELLKIDEEKTFALYNLSILYSHLNRPNWKEYYNKALNLNSELFSIITDNKKMLIPCDEVDRKLNNKFGKLEIEDIENITKDMEENDIKIVID